MYMKFITALFTLALSGNNPNIYQWMNEETKHGISKHWNIFLNDIVVVQWLSRVRLFAASWIVACQAPLSSIISQSLLKFMSIELVMPSSHHPLLLLPSIFPSIRVFSNESAFCIRWPKYWSFSFSISPSNEYSKSISFGIDWFHLLAVQWLSRVFSNTTVWKHPFFSVQPSLWSNSYKAKPYIWLYRPLSAK